MDQNDQANVTLFAARLTPHRSLPLAHFRLLLLIFSGAALLTSLPFIFLGAWPVMGFMGLDVVLFYLAFRANYRDARAYEDVRVTPLDLHLAKVGAHGARTDYHFNPLWVRLEREEDEEFGLQKLAVASRGARVEVARHLDPERKADFARDLSQALADARRGPRYQ